MTNILVLNKTESVFNRITNSSEVEPEINPKLQELLDSKTECIFTQKTDGTCGLIMKIDDKYIFMRRQDIKNKNTNYEFVMNPKNGFIKMIGEKKCYVTSIVRGSGKYKKTVPFYIFQISDDGKPELEFNHLVGFTPVQHNFPDDKYVITAIDGLNGSDNMYLYATDFKNSLNINIIKISIKEFMGDLDIITVEIMGKKISNKYGFIDDRHFVNRHGSIIFPSYLIPPITYEGIKKWFESEKDNRWANTEGIVIHFTTCNMKFKIHRGHVKMEESWKIKNKSGIEFIWTID
jgi:hypothetical protein